MIRFSAFLTAFVLCSCMLLVFPGCSKRMKGYSATIGKKTAEGNQVQGGAEENNPAVVYDDQEFFDLIAKIESGEYEPEPVREQDLTQQVVPEIEIPEGKTVEIKEKLFLTQINDIYFNFESYKDKTIVVEGMFTYLESYTDDSKYPAVYRRGPGCCGNDGWGGFMLNFKGKAPELDEWIRVVGKPFIKNQNGYEDLYLKVSSLEVKKERGAEFVQN